jgi:Ca-activated chloride channel family protein
MTFAAPDWFWLLLALPLLVVAELLGVRRDEERLARLVARPLWPRVVDRPGGRWRFVRLALLVLGTAALVTALARPQWGIVREKVEREGVDVVFLLDTSGSMATPDVPPNRFFLARAGLMSLIPRLEEDRLALVAFEGEAYPLVPLTLDADAIGLFLDTLEPGVVPAPGSSLGQGLERGLALFVDRERAHKVMVLVSDGEDLEGDIEGAVKKAKEIGVVVHTVGVGTEQGQPVPELDEDGRVVGFKRDESGAPVVSRLNPATLESIASATGGRMFRLTAADSSLAPLAAAIDAMEQRSLAREFSYRKKERFQVPLGIALAAFTLALLLPWPRRARRAVVRAAAALLVLSLTPAAADAQATASPTPAPPAEPRPAAALVDEVLLKPRRLTDKGRAEYAAGDHAQASQDFAQAASIRPRDPGARYNVAVGRYKTGRYDEADAAFRALTADVGSPVAGPARYGLGNVLYQKQDYGGAVQAYRDALRVMPDDESTRRNLELALRALQKQQDEQKKDQDKDDQDQDQDQKDQDKQKPQPAQPDPQQPPKTEQQKEEERFQKEAGMPRDRAMQLLDALQRNEAAEQRKAMQKQQPQRREGRDW